MHRNILLLVAAVFALAGCANPDGSFGTKQFIGGIGGAAAGGAVGSQFGKGGGQTAFTILGTVLGMAAGAEVGASLDRADLAYQQQAVLPSFSAARTNQQIEWMNPQTGNYGVMVPTANWRQPDGMLCREFWQKVYIGGRAQEATGTACLQRDGVWRIV